MNLKVQFEDTKKDYDALLAKSLGEEEAYQNSFLGKLSKHVTSIPFLGQRQRTELDQGLPQKEGDHLQQGERVWNYDKVEKLVYGSMRVWKYESMEV